MAARWLAETNKEEPWRGVTIITLTGGGRPETDVPSGSETSNMDVVDNWSMAPEHGSMKDGGREVLIGSSPGSLSQDITLKTT